MDRGKNKVAAGVLGILLGQLGIHHFYLGSNVTGIIMLAATLVSCGTLAAVCWVVSIAEGIMLLIMDDAEFDAKYNAREPESIEFVFQKKHLG